MEFLISASFTDALARLPAQDQKAVKLSAFDLQTDPTNPGLQFHRVDKSKDENFWSVRVNRDIRIIIHRTEASMLLAYVDHHDKAYGWAARRRIEAHPKTGAIQIVEVRERVEEIALPPPPTEGRAPAASIRPFSGLSDDQLLSIGVPTDWLADVRAAGEDAFLELGPHLPAEAAESLLQFATTGVLNKPAPAPADPYAHPDAQRRFRVIENVDELAQALDSPWEKWMVFLHPSQREIVDKDFAGPARVAGSAGTGKTVVALHRAVRLAKTSPDARVLLATFSDPLAASLATKVRLLAGPETSVIPRIRVASLPGVAAELFELATGRRAHVAKDDQIARALERAAAQAGLETKLNFLRSEWSHVVDAWQVADVAEYLAVPRLGRDRRLGSKQREQFWPVFAAARADLASRGFYTWPGVFSAVTRHFADKATKPFSHIVIDEAQDLGVPELRLLAAIAPAGNNGLFFSGDLGQRIFQQPFSWKALGVDVRGRAATLKVNYRTSHQIRRAADRLLPGPQRDVDGVVEERKGAVSVFNGPEPKIVVAQEEAAETSAVVAFIRDALSDGVAPREIGVFTRTVETLVRARAAVQAAGAEALELSERGDDPGERISIGTMHLAKGLEFKAVAVIACDEDALPLRSRIDLASDETELEDVYETERQLLYVAATRARDRLLVTGVKPGSEFLRDMGATLSARQN
ncbi:MAG TPA: 3'-5' exonuclease [Roseiarcus sp.]|nr:3'-5' exonuclease [Roseiarcus sp.]